MEAALALSAKAERCTEIIPTRDAAIEANGR
jgi:hypothetical protein